MKEDRESRGEIKAIAVIVVIAIAAIAIYFITGPKPEDEVVSEEEVVIWHNFFPAVKNTAEEMIENEFKQLYPEISLKFMYVGDIKTRIVAAIPIGQGPDIFFWAHDWIGEFAEGGFVVPLDEFMTPELKNKFTPTALEACTYKGKMYALPTAGETVTLLYNKALISEDEVPETMDELKTVMAEFTNLPEKEYGIDYYQDPYFSTPWVHVFGGYFIDKETKEVGLTLPGTIRGYKFILENFKPYMVQEWGGEAQTAVFLAGRAPFCITGPWGVGAIKDAGIDLGATLLPSVPEGTPMGYSGMMALYMTSLVENKESAWTFINWWCTSVNNTVRRAKEHGFVPVLKSVLEMEEIKTDSVIMGYAKQLEFSISMPAIAEMGQCWGPIRTAQEKMWAGVMSVEDALAEAKTEIEREIQE